jgi:hypothetical protein
MYNLAVFIVMEVLGGRYSMPSSKITPPGYYFVILFHRRIIVEYICHYSKKKPYEWELKIARRG